MEQTIVVGHSSTTLRMNRQINPVLSQPTQTVLDTHPRRRIIFNIYNLTTQHNHPKLEIKFTKVQVEKANVHLYYLWASYTQPVKRIAAVDGRSDGRKNLRELRQRKTIH